MSSAFLGLRPLRRTQGTVVSRVVVLGAGLAGLAAACHLTGRGYEVTVLERQEPPRWPSRTARPGRLHLRHGTHRAHHARPGRRRPAGASDARPRHRCPCAASTRPTARASPTAAPSTSGTAGRRCGPRSAGPAAAPTRPPSTVSSTGCCSCTRWRCRTSSTATTTPRSGCSPPRGPLHAAPAGCVRSARCRGPPNGSATRGCTGCSVSRPCTPGSPPTRPWRSTP